MPPASPPRGATTSRATRRAVGAPRWANPILGALADNGGPTNTHALGPTSPAIGAASQAPDRCTGTDQRGVARPQGGACDIGAYEYGPRPRPAARSASARGGQEREPAAQERHGQGQAPGPQAVPELSEGEQLPVGTTVDTLKGRVTLVAAGGPDGGLLRRRLQDRPGQGTRPTTTLTLTEKLSCPKAGNASAAAKEEEAPPVGRRQRQVPHEGQAQRGDGGRHEVAGRGSLQVDAHPRRPRPRLGARLREEEDGDRAAPASATSLARVDTAVPPARPSALDRQGCQSLRCRGRDRMPGASSPRPPSRRRRSYVVNTTADPSRISPARRTTARCARRSTQAGADDSINVPAGTYVLTRSGSCRSTATRSMAPARARRSSTATTTTA